jgi:hypothetical protein
MEFLTKEAKYLGISVAEIVRRIVDADAARMGRQIYPSN